MQDNLHQLPEIVRWAARNRFSFVIVTHMVAYNTDMTGSAAFVPVTDLSQQVHRQWRERAAADGVDLNQPLSLFMHVGPGEPEEYRRAEYIAKMVAHASQQDVPSPTNGCCGGTRRLCGRPASGLKPRRRSRVRRESTCAFRPPSTRARRCDFVEDGSFFVSWDGDVHPCYSLWHRYSCHIGGYASRCSRGRSVTSRKRTYSQFGTALPHAISRRGSEVRLSLLLRLQRGALQLRGRRGVQHRLLRQQRAVRSLPLAHRGIPLPEVAVTPHTNLAKEINNCEQVWILHYQALFSTSIGSEQASKDLFSYSNFRCIACITASRRLCVLSF